MPSCYDQIYLWGVPTLHMFAVLHLAARIVAHSRNLCTRFRQASNRHLSTCCKPKFILLHIHYINLRLVQRASESINIKISITNNNPNVASCKREVFSRNGFEGLYFYVALSVYSIRKYFNSSSSQEKNHLLGSSRE